jgi:hypothetical protein
MATPQLSERLYGLFYDVFRRTGVPITIDQMDALKKVTDNITTAIQDEIKEGMKKVAVIAITEMKALEKRVTGKDGQENVEEKIVSVEGPSNTSIQ